MVKNQKTNVNEQTINISPQNRVISKEEIDKVAEKHRQSYNTLKEDVKKIIEEYNKNYIKDKNKKRSTSILLPFEKLKLAISSQEKLKKGENEAEIIIYENYNAKYVNEKGANVIIPLELTFSPSKDLVFPITGQDYYVLINDKLKQVDKDGKLSEKSFEVKITTQNPNPKDLKDLYSQTLTIESEKDYNDFIEIYLKPDEINKENLPDKLELLKGLFAKHVFKRDGKFETLKGTSINYNVYELLNGKVLGTIINQDLFYVTLQKMGKIFYNLFKNYEGVLFKYNTGSAFYRITTKEGKISCELNSDSVLKKIESGFNEFAKKEFLFQMIFLIKNFEKKYDLPEGTVEFPKKFTELLKFDNLDKLMHISRLKFYRDDLKLINENKISEITNYVFLEKLSKYMKDFDYYIIKHLKEPYFVDSKDIINDVKLTYGFDKLFYYFKEIKGDIILNYFKNQKFSQETHDMIFNFLRALLWDTVKEKYKKFLESGKIQAEEVKDKQGVVDAGKAEYSAQMELIKEAVKNLVNNEMPQEKVKKEVVENKIVMPISFNALTTRVKVYASGKKGAADKGRDFVAFIIALYPENNPFEKEIEKIDKYLKISQIKDADREKCAEIMNTILEQIGNDENYQALLKKLK